MRRLLIIGLLLAAALAATGAWWLNRPLDLAAPTVDLSIEPGMSPRAVAQASADAGADVNPTLLFWWFRLSGDARQIRAGSYELTAGVTPVSLLRMLVRGEESLRSITLVEGWNWRQVRQALARAEMLKPDSQAALAYRNLNISERHRHRYEFNQAEFRKPMEEKGLAFTGVSPDGTPSWSRMPFAASRPSNTAVTTVAASCSTLAVSHLSRAVGPGWAARRSASVPGRTSRGRRGAGVMA